MTTKKSTQALYMVLGIFMLLFGAAKIFGAPMTIENFKNWNLGDQGRIAIGVIEVVIGGGLILKDFRSYSALALLLNMTGASMVHIVFKEFSVLALPLVVGSLALYLLIREKHLQM